MSTPSRPVAYTKVLGTAESKIARVLLGGQPTAIAKAVLQQDDVKEAITKQLIGALNEECTNLCKKKNASLFRAIPVDRLASFKWIDMVEDLKQKAPVLFSVLYTIVSSNDRRNTTKVGSVHYPAICTAVAALLKEKNRETLLEDFHLK